MDTGAPMTLADLKERIKVSYDANKGTIPMTTGGHVCKYLIVCGDPGIGFWYMGPFRTREQAHTHAEVHMRPENHWWVEELLLPDKGDGRI
jgi:hypothetical protein